VICQDLALAGAPCEPAVQPIFPPAWYETYGDPSGGGSCTETEDGGSICTATAETQAATPDPAPEG
jgi:hypothetical protein